jgi:hypothetical protein
MKSELWPPLFAFTKEFLKNTKENLPPDHFCANLRQDGQIDLPSSPDCLIFIVVSKNTLAPDHTMGNLRLNLKYFPEGIKP